MWTIIAAPMFSQDGTEVRYAGRFVMEVLEEQRGQGIDLMYSSQLVPDTLRVLREPQTRTAPALINEILAPHGLGLSRIAENQYAVVTLHKDDTNAAVEVPAVRPGHNKPVEVVVTSSRYELAGESGSSRTFLTQRQVESLPRLDDTLGAVQRLPGVASSRLSALGYIRGGESSETQIVLNGLALHEPFHLKNFLTPVSVLNSRVVEGMEVYTGGFTAVYGNRLSAIVDAETLSDTGHHELGLGLYHLTGLTSGRFAGRDGQFLAALRLTRHKPAQLRDDMTFGAPGYRDSFAQVSYSVTDATRLTFNALKSDDDTSLVRLPEGEMAQANYTNEYFWGELQHDWSKRWRGRWLASLTTVDHERAGETGARAGRLVRITDARSYEVLGLKFDGEYAGERFQQRWGMEARLSQADYRYTSSAGRDIALKPTGWQYGLYASSRVQPLPRFTAEAGLRWDRQTYTGVAQTPRAQHQFSPRINLLYQPDEATRLRGSWGWYFQPQSVDELQVEDGIERFFPAQRADHIVVSLERDISPLMRLRIEAYSKDYSRLRPRYENLFDTMMLLPELQADRVRIAPDAADARAIEVLLQARERSPWNWWLSYTLSRAIDRIEGREERRSWNQPHAMQAGLSRAGRLWEWTLAASWHSGWPRTLLSPAAVMEPSDFAPGPRNTARLNDFASLDLSISRRIALAKGELLISAEATNVLERENECCSRYSTTSDVHGVHMEREMRHWLPLVTSLGVLWKF